MWIYEPWSKMSLYDWSVLSCSVINDMRSVYIWHTFNKCNMLIVLPFQFICHIIETRKEKSCRSDRLKGFYFPRYEAKYLFNSGDLFSIAIIFARLHDFLQGVVVWAGKRANQNGKLFEFQLPVFVYVYSLEKLVSSFCLRD